MKAETRQQIIAMLYQNMDKADAEDTLQLVDKYAHEVAKAQKKLDFKIMTNSELSPPGIEELFWDTPLVTQTPQS